LNAIPLRRTASRTGPAREAARQLQALVHETVSSGAARQALLLRLSTLPRALAQPHHLRLAVEALEPLAAADRARLFLLPNHDAAIVWRGPAAAALAECQDRLSSLLAGAPPGYGADVIARHLALPDQADTLLDAVAASLLPPPPPAPALPRAPLDLAALATLEAALARADLSRFARRRPVCTLFPTMRPAWEMRLFSLPELAETLAPDRDLKAAPWLFRRLTRTLDHRMMALLAAPRELDGAGPFGLALNVASLLSPAFLRFDAALPARLRGEVVIALRPDDLLADPPAFLFARGFAQARGYRLLLTAATAGAFPPEATGIDLLQVTWHPGLAHLPAGRIVLAGADTTAALDWARAHGVAYVTGALVRAAR
jgi:hypothetical protein